MSFWKEMVCFIHFSLRGKGGQVSAVLHATQELDKLVTFGEIFSCVSTSRLLASLCGNDRLVGTGEQVAELKSLDKIAVS